MKIILRKLAFLVLLAVNGCAWWPAHAADRKVIYDYLTVRKGFTLSGAATSNVAGSSATLSGTTTNNTVFFQTNTTQAAVQLAASQPNVRLFFYPGHYYGITNIVTTNGTILEGPGAIWHFAGGGSNYMIHVPTNTTLGAIIGLTLDGGETGTTWENNPKGLPYPLTGYATVPNQWTGGNTYMSNRSGIKLAANAGGYLQSVTVQGFSGYGIFIVNQWNQDAYVHERTATFACKAFDNYIGLWGYCGPYDLDGRTSGPNLDAHYLDLGGWTIAGNTIGAGVGAGNVNLTGNLVNANWIGLFATGNGILGHGIIAANNINHNTHAVYFFGMDTGYYLRDNVFLGGGDLWFDDCKQINLMGNKFETQTVTFTNAAFQNRHGYSFFINNTYEGILGTDFKLNLIQPGCTNFAWGNWSDTKINSDGSFNAMVAGSQAGNGDGIRTVNGFLPPLTSSHWLVPAYLSGSYSTFLSTPTAIDTGTNTARINEERLTVASPWFRMIFQPYPVASSNMSFTVPVFGTGTFTVGVVTNDNPLSPKTTTYTLAGNWTNATISWVGTNAVHLLCYPGAGKTMICSNPFVTMSASFTDPVFANPFVRWDLDQSKVKDNAADSFTSWTKSGYSAMSHFDFYTTATNLTVEVEQAISAAAVGAVAVFTNGVLCTYRATPSSGALIGLVSMLSLPTLTGKTFVQVFNGYTENAGATTPANGAFARAIYTDAGASVEFEKNENQSVLLALGDSILGQVTDSATVVPDHWATQLERQIGVRVVNMQMGYGEVKNESTNWPSTLRAVAKYQPSFVLINYGQNDYQFNADTVPAFTNYYGSLVDLIHMASPATRVLALLPIPTTTETANGGGFTLNNYRTGISNIIVGRESFVQLLDGFQVTNNNTYKSGLHLTTSGNMKLAWLIREGIRNPPNGALSSLDYNGNVLPVVPRHFIFTGTITTNTVFPASTAAQSSPAFAGAQIFSDGTNLCVVFKNGGGALTTNKLSMVAWP